jgi:hypothetical protein
MEVKPAYTDFKNDTIWDTAEIVRGQREFEMDSVKYLADTTIIYYWENGGDWVMNSEQAVPIVIRDSTWLRTNLKIERKPTTFRLLNSFFGGRYYHIHHRSEYGSTDDEFTCWRRTRIKRKQYHNYYEDDGPSFFPEKDGNETRVIDTISWTQRDGKKYFLASFSSSDIFEDLLPFQCGRFIPAALGLALFEYEDDSLKLKSFSPCINFTGQWSTADKPAIAVTGKHSFVIIVNDHANGAGSPNYLAASWYVPDSTSFRMVLPMKDSGIDGNGRFTDWHSGIMPDSSAEEFPDINVIRKGVLFVDDTDVVGADVFKKEKKYFEKETMFFFISRQHMHYVNGQYHLLSSSVRTDTTGIAELKLNHDSACAYAY